MMLPEPLGILLGLASMVAAGFWARVVIVSAKGDARAVQRQLALAAASLSIVLGLIAFGFIVTTLAELL